MKCPFRYADGHACSGTIYRARLYGPGNNPRKIRLWCSEKDDHAGAVSSAVGKLRMEFYPNELVRLDLLDEAIELAENSPAREKAT